MEQIKKAEKAAKLIHKHVMRELENAQRVAEELVRKHSGHTDYGSATTTTAAQHSVFAPGATCCSAERQPVS